MATGRIAYDRSTPLGQQLSTALSSCINGRKALSELARIVARYNDDNAGLAADTGIDPASVQAFKDILARASAEMTSDAIVKIDPGAQTNFRVLCDSFG